MNPTTKPKRSLAEIIAEKRAAEREAIQLKAISDNAIIPASQASVASHSQGSYLPESSEATTFPTETKIKRTLAEILASKHHSVSLSAPLPLVAKDLSISPPETFSLSISLNKEQLLARDLAFSGKSFCLVGAAGTGKTTTQREIARALLSQDKLGTHSFKIQGSGGERFSGPSIAFVAYTRIASGNLKRAIHKDPELEEAFQHNITTIHNLLEFEPIEFYDYEKEKMSMRFIPKRTADNPLDITHLIIEEASMVGLDLWFQLYDAIRPNTQIIMLGDINQLPPVFGPSILNYALVQLPVIELTHVYRQKGDSLILENAHKILAGSFPLAEGKGFKIMRNGDVQHSQAKLAQMIGQSFPRFAEAELANPGSGYDPKQDIILSPFNKQDLGTDNINKWIAQFLGSSRNAIVHEVIAGITKLYLAIGDKILYNKQIGEIVGISLNGDYAGKTPLTASAQLTRFGSYLGIVTENAEDFELAGYADIDLDKMLEKDTDLVRQSSHHVKILLETGEKKDLCSVGDFSPSVFSLGYALTIHKAQGCEWRKVFILLHKDHSLMAFRELLYTAITRAREDVILITKDFMIEKAIKNPRIKGNTIEEKVEYFNAGLLDKNAGQPVFCTKEF